MLLRIVVVAGCVVGMVAGGRAAAAPTSTSPWPWPPRHPSVRPPNSHQLRDLGRWPPEPESPGCVDPDRFTDALSRLCGQPPSPALAGAVLTAADEATVDPFLLAALVFDRSRCRSRYRAPAGVGWGLLAIDPGLYRRPGAPRPPGIRDDWTLPALLNPARNLSLGARLLRMWQDSHQEIDRRLRPLGIASHRSAVAHLLWGDRVLGSGGEDLVLTARRRMLAHYDVQVEVARPTTLGIAVVSPLEGGLRVATSGPGEARDGGARRHRGLDIAAAEGEPVRAIADGTVVFAGVNRLDAPRGKPIAPERIARYLHRPLGAGGIYVCLQHGSVRRQGASADRDIVSCYMHLASYSVAVDDRITAGQIIGKVGRTGVKVSPAHLHLEVRAGDRVVNPARVLGDRVIPPPATLTYRFMRAARRARLSAAAYGP